MKTISEALRCAASGGERDCTGCQYCVFEPIPEHWKDVVGEQKHWTSCNIDQIALDAADQIDAISKFLGRCEQYNYTINSREFAKIAREELNEAVEVTE